jgi:hypothetical protein
MVAASTTWGLFLLVLLLGYGLVRVPLAVYNQSRTAYTLARMQFRLSRLSHEKSDNDERLESLVDNVTKYCLQIRRTDPLRTSFERILRLVPEQYADRIASTMNDYENNRITTSHLTDLPTEKQLIQLHERLKASIHIQHRVQAMWKRMVNEVFYLEDICTNEANADRAFVTRSPVPSTWLRSRLFKQHPKLGKRIELLLVNIEKRTTSCEMNMSLARVRLRSEDFHSAGSVSSRMVDVLFSTSMDTSHSWHRARSHIVAHHLVGNDLFQYTNRSIDLRPMCRCRSHRAQLFNHRSESSSIEHR